MTKTLVLHCALLGILGLGPLSATAQERLDETLSVFVYNHTSVPADVLTEAQTLAGTILSTANVATRWFDGGRTSTDRATKAAWREAGLGRRLVIHLIPRSASPAGPLAADQLGFAPIGSGVAPSLAYVFYDQVVRTAGTFDTEIDALLGYSLAHEIGHLLLGAESHADSGIMRAVWRSSDIEAWQTGGFGFTDDQIRELAVRIRSRAAGPAERIASAEPQR